MIEPVEKAAQRTVSRRRKVVVLPDALPVQRRVVSVKATGPADEVGIGDLAVLERKSVASRTLSRLVEDLVARGAAGLIVPQELADSLPQAEREDIAERLPLMVVGADFERSADRLLRPTPAPTASHPDAVLRSILRGQAPAGALPSNLEAGRPVRALAILAHPDERVPLPLSKLEEVVATEALLSDPRAHAATVDGVVVALTGNYVRPNEIEGLGRAMLHRARSALLLSSATVGIGRPYAGTEGLRRTYREALWAATVAESLWGDNRVITFRELGIYGMLEPYVRDPATADTEDVERLIAYDKKNHTALLPTVEAFFDAGSSGDAAAALFVHRNTISYRLRAVKRVTGLDIVDEADARLLLEVQLRLARLRGLLPAIPERPKPKRRARSSS
ncbi:MAG TPA: helix-turn-helix domain-containing protein [Actinomycetota bacterium]